MQETRKAILQVDQLRKTFTLSAKQRQLEGTKEKRKVAVDHLSFSAYEGEIYGLLGPNGAGKTTTLRMLATLIKPDSGTATIAGLDLVREAEKIRGKIAFLTSELKLEAFFTPNYLYDFFSDLHAVPEEKREQRKKEMYARFGIGDFAEVKVANLSSGMKQKVSLAISLVHDPDFIVFDEPTNGLDVLTAKVVTDFLQELRLRGKTIIVSTHIFSLVEKVCDRVGIIINGRMVDEGSLAQVQAGESLEDRFFAIYQREVGEQA